MPVFPIAPIHPESGGSAARAYGTRFATAAFLPRLMLLGSTDTASGLGQHLRLKAPIERDRFVPPYSGLIEVGVPGISDPMALRAYLSEAA